MGRLRAQRRPFLIAPRSSSPPVPHRPPSPVAPPSPLVVAIAPQIGVAVENGTWWPRQGWRPGTELQTAPRAALLLSVPISGFLLEGGCGAAPVVPHPALRWFCPQRRLGAAHGSAGSVHVLLVSFPVTQ